MNNELKHYGVPGMRWGRRKNAKTSRIKNEESKNKNTELSKEVVAARKEKGKRITKTVIKTTVGIGTAALVTTAAVKVGKAAINTYMLSEIADTVSSTLTGDWW